MMQNKCLIAKFRRKCLGKIFADNTLLHHSVWSRLAFLVALSSAIIMGAGHAYAARLFLPGGFYARGVSSGFPTIVGTYSGLTGIGTPYRWTPQFGREDMVLLSGTFGALASAISDDGATMVGYCEDTNHNVYPCRWDSNLQPHSLSFNGVATAVSGDGKIIVGYAFPEFAVRWSASGGLVYLPGFGVPQTSSSLARRISVDGTTIVGDVQQCGTNGCLTSAAVWTGNSVASLGPLPSNSLLNGASYALAVSKDGQVVAGSYDAVDGRHAFRWTASAGMSDIGALGFFNSGMSMSADGKIIAIDGDHNSQMIWTESTGMISLGDYLAGQVIFPNTLLSLAAISPDGRWLTGTTDVASGNDYRGDYLVDLFTPSATNSTANALAAASGNSALVWSTSTNSPWAFQSYITHDGEAALESGYSANQSIPSVLQATVTGPGVVSFWWRVSSPGGASNFVFSISGIPKKKISGGDSGWLHEAFAVPAGTRTLTWTYSKVFMSQYEASLGSGWVDEVLFIAASNAPYLLTAFADDFETNSASAWSINQSSSDVRATFNYDYSANGIPPAPHSTGGTTRGVKLEANMTNGVVAALSMSPVGKAFSGDYRLSFDMWINVNMCCAGTTESLTAGIGTSGNQVQWTGSGNLSDGCWFALDGEGGVADTSGSFGDFIAFTNGTPLTASSGVYSAGTASNARGNFNAFYQEAFPGGTTPPVSQGQSGALAAGTLGLNWHDVIISKTGSNVTWQIDGLTIAVVANVSLTGSNIFIGYWDPFASVSDHQEFSFGLVDNVRVEVPAAIPPSITTNLSNKIVEVGTDVSLSIGVSGTAPFSYQWYFNNAMLSGKTNSSLVLSNVTLFNRGGYSVVVTDANGSITSSVATVTVALSPSVTQAASGRLHSLLLKSDGSLWSMGYNFFGQLGNGTNTGTNRAHKIVASGVKAIATGNDHSLFLKTNSSLWTVGIGYSGELGNGASAPTSLPGQIVASSVTDLDGGGSHTLFIKADGSLWGNGDNSFGQLGDGTGFTDGSVSHVSVPRQILPGGVAAISAGYLHSLVVKTNGSLWVSGLNTYGALGDGTYLPTNQFEQVVGSGVIAVAAGRFHSLFLKSDGSLWGMGYNSYGQLGDGTYSNTNQPEQIVADGVTAIAAGKFFSLFLRNDGSLWGMGDNSFGQLGDGTFTGSNTPRQIVASGVIQMAAGGQHSLFVKSDGSLWGMGDNSEGQLGDGSYTVTNAPKLIVAGPPGFNQFFNQSQSGGEHQLGFAGYVGAKYALDRTFSLLPPAWIPQFTNTTDAGGVVLFTNTPNPATNNFWRVRLVP